MIPAVGDVVELMEMQARLNQVCGSCIRFILVLLIVYSYNIDYTC